LLFDAGAVFESLMISTSPSNDKIYTRCVHLISSKLYVSPADAEAALLRSVYGLDVLPESLLSAPRVQHIKAALLPVERRHECQAVLPVAFLLAASASCTVSCTVASARQAVAEEPRLEVLLGAVFRDASNRRREEKAIVDGGTADATAAAAGASPALPAAIPAVDACVSEAPASPACLEYCIGVDVGGTFVRAAAVVLPKGKFISAVVKKTIVDRYSCHCS
jgi:hypothetical protein